MHFKKYERNPDETKLNDIITHRFVHSWDGLYKLYRDEFQHANEEENLWIFRGQERDDWPMESLLRRYLTGFEIKPEEYRDKELGLIRKFQREYQHYNKFIPEKNDLVHWLSIMQHYGCPTRLLDFDYSFFIALWMAIEAITKIKDSDSWRETCKSKPCFPNYPENYKICPGAACIWAIESKWLDKKVKHCSPARYGIIRQLENKSPNSINNYSILNNRHFGVYPVNPFELNERLRVQQGLFLIPFNIEQSMEENILAVIGKDDKEIKANIIKIHLCLCENSKFIKDCLRELKRMGITTASIYPGLEGYARSLKNLIPLEKGFLDPGE
ncbi:MAG: FRG domain-containing protein [Brevinematales bacterium]|nr:FRG domain-containing protein [Brevinematales bacterium]